ncbi:hypothetical protein QEN19_003800 [Hanseniaspora menglaensis]
MTTTIDRQTETSTCNLKFDYTLSVVYKELKKLKNLQLYKTNRCILSEKSLKQVRLDCDRSFGGAVNITDEEESVYQNELYNVIVSILKLDSSLNYYQGFHDIIALFLYCFTVLDKHKHSLCYKYDLNRTAFVELLFVFTKKFLADFMRENIADTMIYLSYIPKLVKKINYNLYKELNVCNANNTVNYPLSNIITLFNHDTNSERYAYTLLIIRYLLEASNISFVLILYTVLLNDIQDKIYHLISDNAGSKDDFAIIYFKINNYVSKAINDMPIEKFKIKLEESNKLIKENKIKNTFKYSIKNKHLLINFDFDSEKNILIKISLVSVNLFLLGTLKQTSSYTSPISIITSLFSIYNIYKTISS